MQFVITVKATGREGEERRGRRRIEGVAFSTHFVVDGKCHPSLKDGTGRRQEDGNTKGAKEGSF